MQKFNIKLGVKNKQMLILFLLGYSFFTQKKILETYKVNLFK